MKETLLLVLLGMNDNVYYPGGRRVCVIPAVTSSDRKVCAQDAGIVRVKFGVNARVLIGQISDSEM